MRNILVILILTIFIFGCGDDEPNTELTIDLISPLNAMTDYCNVTFEWTISIDTIPVILEVSPNRNFLNATTFRDTIVGTTLTMTKNLQPNKQYYWRIKTENLAKMDSFTVQNVSSLDDFVGTFPATATRLDGFQNIDSTWTTNVEITFNADGIPQMTELGSNLEVLPETHISHPNCDIFSYREEIDFLGQPTGGIIPINDSGTLDITNSSNRTFTFRKRPNSNNTDILIEYTGNID